MALLKREPGSASPTTSCRDGIIHCRALAAPTAVKPTTARRAKTEARRFHIAVLCGATGKPPPFFLLSTHGSFFFGSFLGGCLIALRPQLGRLLIHGLLACLSARVGFFFFAIQSCAAAILATGCALGGTVRSTYLRCSLHGET